MSEIAAEPMKAPAEWTKFEDMTFNVAISPRPIYVIRAKEGYVRFAQLTGKLLPVDRRMATRFDSRVWAATVASAIAGAKIVRLTTKAEREGRKAWTWRKSETIQHPEEGIAEVTTPEPAPLASNPSTPTNGESGT